MFPCINRPEKQTLRPDKDLLNPDFTGYQLSLKEPTKKFSERLQEGVKPLELELKHDDVNFLKVKILSHHNALHVGPFSHNPYYVDDEFNIRSLSNGNISHIVKLDRPTCITQCLPPSVYELQDNLLIASNGDQMFYVVQKQAGQWETKAHKVDYFGSFLIIEGAFNSSKKETSVILISSVEVDDVSELADHEHFKLNSSKTKRLCVLHWLNFDENFDISRRRVIISLDIPHFVKFVNSMEDLVSACERHLYMFHDSKFPLYSEFLKLYPKKDEIETPSSPLNPLEKETLVEEVQPPPTDHVSGTLMDQAEVCDDEELEKNIVIQFISGNLHVTVKETETTGRPFLFKVDGKDMIALRHDVDACIWGLPEEISLLPEHGGGPWHHVSTFDAIGYVMAGKTNRRFTVCNSELNVVAIADQSKHVFLYFKNQPITSSELRQRKKAENGASDGDQASVQSKRIKSIAAQKLITLPADAGAILGIQFRGQEIVILAQNEILSFEFGA